MVDATVVGSRPNSLAAGFEVELYAGDAAVCLPGGWRQLTANNQLLKPVTLELKDRRSPIGGLPAVW